MIRPLSLLNDNNVTYKAEPEHKGMQAESRILPNNLRTRMEQKYQKTTNAFLQYPVKGFRGDVNSDFYEFLTMGIVPYLIGSGMFMGLFNIIPSIKGKKMAMGVLLYGLMKAISNDVVSKPVKWATGIDIDAPIEHIYYPLPKEPGENANIIPQIQQRKVYDSREFFRKDLIQKDIGISYYDKIAKKIGLGENLNDSVTETSPIIQSVVSTTKTAKSLSSYAWAGLGVGLAMQDSWLELFNAISNRKRHIGKTNEGFISKSLSKIKNLGINIFEISKTFIKSLGQSFVSMWKGNPETSGFMKHAGKSWILITAALTLGSITNVIYKAKHMGKLANKDIMDKNKESKVI